MVLSAIGLAGVAAKGGGKAPLAGGSKRSTARVAWVEFVIPSVGGVIPGAWPSYAEAY
jgi:hypothetical protein